MASILTNIGAMSALQTLRNISSQMGNIQGQVSSGLRVEQASDNAAYWSIATTMRSDNGALSAVHDALGLGAAKVDTAYAGMESVIDVMSEFKAKLVAAKEDGIDKSKVQSELEQLKEQVVGIAKSASFNGVNWLDTNISDIYDVASSSTSLVSSFVRSASGNVSVQTTTLDRIETSLFNSTGGGLLQRDDRSPGTVGGLRDTLYYFPSRGSFSHAGQLTFDGPLTFVDNSTAISFNLVLDADYPASTSSPQAGVEATYTIDRGTIDAIDPSLNGVISDRYDWMRIMEAVSGGALQPSRYSGTTADYGLSSSETSARGSSVYMTGVTSTLAGGLTGGLTDMSEPSYGSRARTASRWDGPFEIKPTVEVYVDIDEMGEPGTITLTRDTVMAALGSTNGKVDSPQDLIAVMNYAFEQNGMAIIASESSSTLIRYDLDETVHKEAGTKTSIGVLGARDNIGNVPDFGFLDIDVTTGHSIDGYIDGLESMLKKVTSGAATLGALKSRIDMQSEFTTKLSDSIDKGVGRLVDADMNEASTRLKALQTQQQLAIQSLSIANSNAEPLLSLIR
jgi:flagellin